MNSWGESAPHVVLADDDADDRLLFMEALNDLSVEAQVSIARNGEHLMTMLRDFVALPDLLFLDLNMPYKTGLECLTEIRSDSRLHQMPVVVLSTSTQSITIEQVYDQGANLYIMKPNSFDALHKLLGRVFSIDWKNSAQQPRREEFVLEL
jgi:CheY-like chemotaxis protein